MSDTHWFGGGKALFILFQTLEIVCSTLKETYAQKN